MPTPPKNNATDSHRSYDNMLDNGAYAQTLNSSSTLSEIADFIADSACREEHYQQATPASYSTLECVDVGQLTSVQSQSHDEDVEIIDAQDFNMLFLPQTPGIMPSQPHAVPVKSAVSESSQATTQRSISTQGTQESCTSADEIVWSPSLSHTARTQESCTSADEIVWSPSLSHTAVTMAAMPITNMTAQRSVSQPVNVVSAQVVPIVQRHPFVLSDTQTKSQPQAILTPTYSMVNTSIQATSSFPSVRSSQKRTRSATTSYQPVEAQTLSTKRAHLIANNGNVVRVLTGAQTTNPLVYTPLPSVQTNIAQPLQAARIVEPKQIVDAKLMTVIVQAQMKPIQQQVQYLQQQIQQIQHQYTALQQQIMTMQTQQTHNTMLVQDIQRTLISSNPSTRPSVTQSGLTMTSLSQNSEHTNVTYGGTDYDRIDIDDTTDDDSEDDDADDSKKKINSPTNDDSNSETYVQNIVSEDVVSHARTVRVSRRKRNATTSLTSCIYSSVRAFVHTRYLEGVRSKKKNPNMQKAYTLVAPGRCVPIVPKPFNLRVQYFETVDTRPKVNLTIDRMYQDALGLIRHHVCTHVEVCKGCECIEQARRSQQKGTRSNHDITRDIQKHGVNLGCVCMPIVAHVRLGPKNIECRITCVHNNSIAILKHMQVEPTILAVNMRAIIGSVSNAQHTIQSSWSINIMSASLADIHATTRRALTVQDNAALLSNMFESQLATAILGVYRQQCAQNEQDSDIAAEAFSRVGETTRLATIRKKARLLRDLEQQTCQILTIIQCARRSGRLLMMLANKPALSWLYLTHDINDLIEYTFTDRCVLDVPCAVETVARIYIVAQIACTPRVFQYSKHDSAIQVLDILRDVDPQKATQTSSIEDLVSAEQLEECKQEYFKAIYTKLCEFSSLYKGFTTFLETHNVPCPRPDMTTQTVEDALQKITDGLVDMGFTKIMHTPNNLLYNHYTQYEVYSQSAFSLFIDYKLGYGLFMSAASLAKTRNIAINSICTLCIRLTEATITQEQLTDIIQDFDNKFRLYAQQVINNMQLIGIKHLHNIADYEQRFVGMQQKRFKCAICTILNLGHYDIHENDDEVCFSFACIDAALKTIMDMVPHASFDTHYTLLTRKVTGVRMSSDLERLIVEYLYVQYTAPQQQDNLTAIEQMYAQHDTKFPMARHDYTTHNSTFLLRLLCTLEKHIAKLRCSSVQTGL